MAKTMETARLLAAKSPVALAHAKEATNVALQGGQDANLTQEASLFALVASTDDAKEGMAAFLEKREPRFSGR
jgi:enoyl-CoA hydratase/carnithine racemase